MKILPLAVLRLSGALIGALLTLAGLTPPATATTLVHLSGTVTNTDGVNQSGYVFVAPVGGSGASGTGLSNGAFAWDWDAGQYPAGKYRIYVRSTTMDNAERYFVAGDPAGTDQEAQATQFDLGPDSPPLNLTMVMPAIAKVSGRVVDVHGAGVPDLPVTIYEGGPSRQTVSGPGGAFDLGYTQAGSWQVTVHGGADYLTTQMTVAVPATGSVVIPDVVAHRAGSVEGTVTDSVTGDPLPFVQVQAFNAATHFAIGSQVETDGSGHYRIGKLGSTPFVLRFLDEIDTNHGYAWTLNDGGDPNDWSPQTPITLGEGEARVYNQAMVLKTPPPPPAHTLSGTVTDTGGRPLVAVDVTAGDLVTTTDRSGRWFLDAPDGTYTVSYAQDWHWAALFGAAPGWSREYYPNAFAPSSATALTVSGGVGVDHVDTSLSRAGRITGTVSPAGGALTVDEHEIWVYDASGALVSHESPAGGAGYSVDVPADVPLHLLARGRTSDDPVTEFLPRWYGDVDSLEASTAIQVGPTATVTGKDFVLPIGLTNLSVPVVSGSPVVGHTLTATPGTWSVHTQTEFTTTWLRDGVAVGTGSAYAVTPADAGRSLRVRVTAMNGHSAGQALSSSLTVEKAASTVVARGKSATHGKVKLTITVSAAGPTPAGTVTVTRGTKVVKRGVAVVGGRAVITLKRQPSGSRRYTVSYDGSTQTLPSSGSVKVRVR